MTNPSNKAADLVVGNLIALRDQRVKTTLCTVVSTKEGIIALTGHDSETMREFPVSVVQRCIDGGGMRIL